jgi:hypothetical protein
MSRVKKFSDILSGQMLSESVDSTKVQSAVEVLMNKMGYDNIEELKREKSLISKLETLLKEFSPKTNISEDEAEDIEDEVVKRGTPKKLVELDEDEAEEIEDEVVKRGTPKKLVELDEDEAEEIEDETVKRGTPKKLMEDEAEEIEDETVKMGIPKDKGEEIEDEMDKMVDVKGKEIKANSSKRILSFDEFVSESYDYTVSEAILMTHPDELKDFLNKNQSHFATFLKGKYMAVNVSGHILTIEPKSKSFKITVDTKKGTIDSTGKPSHPESTSYGEIMSFLKYRTKFTVLNEGNAFFAARAKAIQEERDEFEFNGKTYKVTTSTKSINEAEIKSDDEFKEYVTTVLKKAFGKDFDQAKADEVADGLIKKYKGDYGAMVGALQSSMG